jgi:hypothetical protein
MTVVPLGKGVFLRGEAQERTPASMSVKRDSRLAIPLCRARILTRNSTCSSRCSHHRRKVSCAFPTMARASGMRDVCARSAPGRGTGVLHPGAALRHARAVTRGLACLRRHHTTVCLSPVAPILYIRTFLNRHAAGENRPVGTRYRSNNRP